jgi:hypothetical protein
MTPDACNHEWVVFSTCIGDVSLMLQCVNCNAFGTVDNPTKEEWRAGYWAPERPYRWNDTSRVRIRGNVGDTPYVEKPETDTLTKEDIQAVIDAINEPDKETDNQDEGQKLL